MPTFGARLIIIIISHHNFFSSVDQWIIFKVPRKPQLSISQVPKEGTGYKHSSHLYSSPPGAEWYLVTHTGEHPGCTTQDEAPFLGVQETPEGSPGPRECGGPGSVSAIIYVAGRGSVKSWGNGSDLYSTWACSRTDRVTQRTCFTGHVCWKTTCRATQETYPALKVAVHRNDPISLADRHCIWREHACW